MIKKIILFSALIVVASSCVERICPDKIQTPFTEENLKYFPFKTGDTIWYNDADDSIYYLACYNEILTTDTTPHPADKECANVGILKVDQYKEYRFSSNMPHFNEELGILSLQLHKRSDNSLVYIFFGSNPEKDYSYNFLYRAVDNSINRTDYTLVSYRDSLLINEVWYDSIYSVYYSPNSTAWEFAYYDTIYYNKDGFLKFISSEYGYRLERLP